MSNSLSVKLGCFAVGLYAFVVSPAEAQPRARLLPPTEGPDVNTLGVERDATRRIVAYGLRALIERDGAERVAEEILPLSHNVQVIELPSRFGRGFLFSVVASGRTSIWKAASFIGRLEPFASLDVEVERLVPGFDRIYVQAHRSGEWLALDAQTGAGLDRGSLPAASNYGAMAFADEWLGAIELPVRGPLVSFDAGGSWHPLGTPAQIVGADAGDLLLGTPSGRRRLGLDGRLSAVDPPSSALADVEKSEAPARAPKEGPLGRSPLGAAILRGYPETAETALVLVRGAMARVRSADGRVLDLRERAVPPSSECASVSLGTGFGFVCAEPEGKTRIFAFEAPFGLRLIESFDSPRRVISNENGALSIRGGCASSLSAARLEGVYCVRSASGALLELPLAGEGGVERVVARREGGALVLIPPRKNSPGSLVIVSPTGKKKSVPLSAKPRDEVSRLLLAQGFWLETVVETADGKLGGWVTAQGMFAGVRVGLDGALRMGPPRKNLERALFAGQRALVIPQAGIAEQSVDGGMTFTDVDLPPEIQLDPAKAAKALGSLEQGCSAIGCGFVGWLRLGWDGPHGGKPLSVAAIPRNTTFPASGGGRWILRCAPTGEASRPALPSGPAASVSEGQAPWLGLFEEPPPARSRETVSFDTGATGELRAYVAAPRGADFGKAGRFSVAALDPFRARGGVWTTLASQSPWADPAQVAEVFGYEGTTPSAWHLTADSSGRQGVLSVTARGSTELFAVEENRAIVPLLNASRQGLGSITAAVRLGATYYVQTQEDPRTIRIFALENGRARLVGQYADVPLGRSALPTLVRSARGDALGLWTRGNGWFVFPIDPRSGSVGRAVELTPRDLSRRPRTCAPDEEGYVLVGAVAIEPYVDFVDGADRVSSHGFEGRFIVSDHGICVSALSSKADGAIPRDLRPEPKSLRAPAPSVPLVVSDRTDGGRRWAFLCSD